MGKFIKSTAGRRWLYGVALAAVALAGAYGLITDELGVLWVGIVAALLGLPVASGNVTNGGIETIVTLDPSLLNDRIAEIRAEYGIPNDAAYPIPEPHPATEADPERYRGE